MPREQQIKALLRERGIRLYDDVIAELAALHTLSERTDTELEQAAREVVRAYEAVTTDGEWMRLAPPIVALRASLWRIDGLILRPDLSGYDEGAHNAHPKKGKR